MSDLDAMEYNGRTHNGKVDESDDDDEKPTRQDRSDIPGDPDLWEKLDS